ncbi:hypothetical protein F4778DRAFT_734261 [Xylariomycetidae sp. FL2044]|nr:hypothetical protein F4778DRAFT_734261 [Xylariomycetidae sp. FL2044]
MSSLLYRDAALREISDFFATQTQRFRFEGIIANGAFGVTFRVVELGRPRRALALVPPAIPPAPGAPRGRKRRRIPTPPEIVQSVAKGIKRLRVATPSPAQAAKRLRRSLSPRNILNKIRRRFTPPSPGAADDRRSPSPPEGQGDDDDRPVLRRLCVKRAMGPLGEDLLRDEIRTHQELNGSMHLVSLIAYRDDDQGVAPNLASRSLPPVPESSGDFLEGLAGPTIVTEYLENGVWNTFLWRLKGRDTPISNRVLWALYLCAIRACIALAYPRRLQPDRETILEEIPQGVQPSNWLHGDLHDNNIMFGNVNPDVQEHTLIPALKMIDFGCTKQIRRGSAVEQNLYNAAELMYNLIFRRRYKMTENGETRKYKEIRTHAVGLSDDEVPDDIRSDLDPDLRDLICRSMAENVKDRFTLAQALNTTSEAVRNKNAGSYSHLRTADTDADLRQFVQDTIYNSDLVPRQPSDPVVPPIGQTSAAPPESTPSS